MILWTIQPIEIYEKLIETGEYKCDLEKSGMKDFQSAYDWLVEQMVSKIGEPPEGVKYPVWAWYKDGKGIKPDLRHARFAYGRKDEKFACIEIEIPEYEVVLSDFDSWNIILNDGLLSETEDEDEILEKTYESLSEDEKKTMKPKNWERMFDISPLDNDWVSRGEYIQANFWVLKKEQIREVRFFTAG